MTEPTNTDLLIAIAELRGEMRTQYATISGDVQRHGNEIAALRGSLSVLEKQAAKSVTWAGLGGLLAILIPVLALFTTIVLTAK